MNVERLMNMFINLFIRRLMMTIINHLIDGMFRIGRLFTRKPAETTPDQIGRGAENEGTPQLNDFSKRD